ncbi:MAG: metal ABC transporter substrate-binding protein [Candidatus Moduliflexus flocculans]|nr:metal ABC transporter substrate-binding protein [Candidatus Moduliflexus flocculans]
MDSSRPGGYNPEDESPAADPSRGRHGGRARSRPRPPRPRSASWPRSSLSGNSPPPWRGEGEASLLLPPGAGVHTWQPRPGDIARLADCDLLLFIGSGLEPWLPGLLKAFPGGRFRTFEAAAELALAESGEEPGHDEAGHDHGPLDPHVWLDFELDLQIVDGIAAELGRIDPEGRPLFAANAGKLKSRLTALDAAFPGRSGRMPGQEPRPGGARRLRLPGPALRPRPESPLRPQPGLPAASQGPHGRRRLLPEARHPDGLLREFRSARPVEDAGPGDRRPGPRPRRRAQPDPRPAGRRPRLLRSDGGEPGPAPGRAGVPVSPWT